MVELPRSIDSAPGSGAAVRRQSVASLCCDLHLPQLPVDHFSPMRSLHLAAEQRLLGRNQPNAASPDEVRWHSHSDSRVPLFQGESTCRRSPMPSRTAPPEMMAHEACSTMPAKWWALATRIVSIFNLWSSPGVKPPPGSADRDAAGRRSGDHGAHSRREGRV